MKNIFFLFLLLCSCYISGQTIESLKNQTTWQNFKYDIGSIGGGIGHAFSRPAHWKGKEWLNFAGIATGTAILTLGDDEIDNWTDGIRNDISNDLLEFGGHYARPEGNYGLSSAVYFTGLFIKNEKLRRTGVLMIASTITGGFLQQLSIRILNRARPLTGESANNFDLKFFEKAEGYDSFFSGHTVLSFANAYAIGKQFNNPWVKAGIYTVGMIPGFTRIIISKHWFSDVVFGTVMSILIVESIDKYLDSRYEQKYNENNKKVHWDLTFAPGRIGVKLNFN
ncbi:phosphatase PAP2 family protein [Algibacter sp. L4_22]|uniref:phosphatase PAP2 family protein n=1 Tax=Algibacter sp. L4_22 TaxID=2942477 RepID=UPI00201B6D19|nr:phosphatase PAP2 family protein [Algibacter sp. L4_22]MCL5127963.1 phosphatase PAP2 family protein [Algibacter sp. L4_22]